MTKQSRNRLEHWYFLSLRRENNSEITAVITAKDQRLSVAMTAGISNISKPSLSALHKEHIMNIALPSREDASRAAEEWTPAKEGVKELARD
jgi:hypothetical protein